MQGDVQQRITTWRGLLAIVIGGVIALAFALIYRSISGPPDPFAVDRSPAQEAELIQQGRTLFEAHGCIECHTPDGGAIKGPPLAGIVGRRAQLVANETAMRDHLYLRRAIVDPRAQVVEGYAFQLMPEHDYFDEQQMQALLIFIRSIPAEGPVEAQ